MFVLYSKKCESLTETEKLSKINSSWNYRQTLPEVWNMEIVIWKCQNMEVWNMEMEIWKCERKNDPKINSGSSWNCGQTLPEGNPGKKHH